MIIVTRQRLLLLALSASILLSGFAAPAQSRLKGAAKAPAVVRTVNTETLSALLKPDGSGPLLVNFWATWCDPCRDEFPDLVKIDSKYRSRGLDFIAISLDDLKDIKTEVPKFLRLMRAKMPVYLLDVADPQPAIKAVDSKWSGALPATFLYNQEGQLVYKHLGRVNAAELRAAIDKVMSNE